MAVILPEAHTKTGDPAWSDSSTQNSGSLHKTNDKETFVIRYICAFFRRWAYFIAAHPIKVIIICNILTFLGAAKMAVTPNQNDITGWTPYGARSLYELDVTKEYFGGSGQSIAILVLLLAKDGGSLLTVDRLKEAKAIENHIASNFTLMNHDTGKPESFREFCWSFCQINEPLVQFTNGFIIQDDRARAGDELNDRIELQYPLTHMYGRKMSIQPTFFGVDFYDNTTMSEPSNSTDVGMRRITNMKESKMIALQIRAGKASGWVIDEIKIYEQSITDYYKKVYKSDLLEVYTLSTTYIESEVVRAGYTMLPIFVIGFGIMLAVSSITTFISAAYMQQLSIHKFSLALFACITPFMACGTALGALFYGGVRFGSVLAISPFLVLAIGVDDAYLMIHAWQRVSKKLRSHPVPEDSPGYRLAEVLTDIGPAIIISALTNIFADAVGTFTGCPEVTLLSYGNMACIGVDFLYQISFYAAIMVIAGNFEMKAEKQKKNKLSIEIGDDNSVDINGECCPKVSADFHDGVKDKFNAFLECYVDLINNKIFDVLVFMTWGAYIALCVYGISIMEVNLSPKKLFVGDSDLIIMEDLRNQYVYRNYVPIQVFVNNPGNLSDPARLDRLNEFINEFETMPNALGPVSSNYFVRDFLEYEKTAKDDEIEIDEEEESADSETDTKTTTASPTALSNVTLFNPNDLQTFVEWPEYEFWRGFIFTSKDEHNKTKLDKFFFTTAFYGERFLEWKSRAVAMKEWRVVIDKYQPIFNTTIYYDEGVYIDLMNNMPTDTWQSAVGTLSCMAFICFVFMFDLFTVTVTTAAIASVMCGILGLNSLLGMELDPIVMASLVISVGFSVDIPAHVSYHFHMAGAHLEGPISVRQRLRYCLASVGFPAVQAAVSTNLCVVALLFADVYTSRVFVRVMVLCVSLCLLHGLVVIPCAMSLLTPVVDFVKCKKNR